MFEIQDSQKVGEVRRFFENIYAAKVTGVMRPCISLLGWSKTLHGFVKTELSISVPAPG